MRILITGICGFVGSEIAQGLSAAMPEVQLLGIDNFSSASSRLNVVPMCSLGSDLIER